MFEFAAPVGTLSQKRLLFLTCFVFAGQNVHSGKFKHITYSENVNFAGTNDVDSILVLRQRDYKSGFGSTIRPTKTLFLVLGKYCDVKNLVRFKSFL